MAEPRDLLRELRASGVQLWVRDGRLRYRSADPLSADQLTRLRRSKAEIGAVRELVRRHEVLRTSYPSVDGFPVQVDEEAKFAIDRVDLTGHPAPKRTAQVRELIRWHARRRFDLACECPFLVQLARLADDDHILIVNSHHIMIDGPSFDILFRELQVIYEAYARGQGSPLADPIAQYADYAVWQRRWLQNIVLDEQLAYWKARLAGAPESLDLPVDRPRPAVPTFAGDVVEFTISPALMDALTERARKQDATLFMVLLASFQVRLICLIGRRWSVWWGILRCCWGGVVADPGARVGDLPPRPTGPTMGRILMQMLAGVPCYG